MQIRVSALDFVVVGCYVIIFGFLWRSLAAKLADKPIGKAMAYIF
jgi:hypothetical protein